MEVRLEFFMTRCPVEFIFYHRHANLPQKFCNNKITPSGEIFLRAGAFVLSVVKFYGDSQKRK